MTRFDQLLASEKPIILDGAMGTELEYQGYNVAGNLWSAKYLAQDASALTKIHLDYLRAGATIITSASYQASFPGLLEAGYAEEEIPTLLQKSVHLVQQAITTYWSSLSQEEKETRIYPLAAASLGPYAAYLADGSEYTGVYQVSKEELKTFHLPRIQALLEAKPDLLLIETIPNFLETEALLELLETDFSTVQALISFTSQDGATISDGTPIEEVADLCDKCPQILAIGLNCTAPHHISSLLKKMRGVTQKPLATYPNSGEIYDGIHKTWHQDPDNQHTLAENSLEWAKEGVQIFGGCCRTRPSDIQNLAQQLTKQS